MGKIEVGERLDVLFCVVLFLFSGGGGVGWNLGIWLRMLMFFLWYFYVFL